LPGEVFEILIFLQKFILQVGDPKGSPQGSHVMSNFEVGRSVFEKLGCVGVKFIYAE